MESPHSTGPQFDESWSGAWAALCCCFYGSPDGLKSKISSQYALIRQGVERLDKLSEKRAVKFRKRLRPFQRIIHYAEGKTVLDALCMIYVDIEQAIVAAEAQARRRAKGKQEEDEISSESEDDDDQGLSWMVAAHARNNPVQTKKHRVVHSAETFDLGAAIWTKRLTTMESDVQRGMSLYKQIQDGTYHAPPTAKKQNHKAGEGVCRALRAAGYLDAKPNTVYQLRIHNQDSTEVRVYRFDAGGGLLYWFWGNRLSHRVSRENGNFVLYIRKGTRVFEFCGGTYDMYDPNAPDNP